MATSSQIDPANDTRRFPGSEHRIPIGNRPSGWSGELGREGLDAYLGTKAISIALGAKA